MKNRAAEIHDGLKHPVIDGDGHWTVVFIATPHHGQL
jgi:hypothetical protein